MSTPHLSSPTMEETAESWYSLRWQYGTTDWNDIKSRKHLGMPDYFKDLYVRVSMTDAALALTNGKVADNYIEAAEVITELRQEIAQIKERLESSHHASTSNTGRGLLDVDEDEDYFVVLKNVTKIDAAAAELGDFSWLPGLALEDGVLTFVRTLSVACGFCSLVVQVVKEKREGLRKLAKVWAKKKNVVMVPYLSRPSMLLRQERTAIYKGLAEAGAEPKWTGSADIEYLNGEGERVLSQF